MNYDKKIREYEDLAVKTVNSMRNTSIKAEAGKNTLETFPDLQLASLHPQQRKPKRLLSVFLLATTLATGGYSIDQHFQQKQTQQELTQITQQLENTKSQLEQEVIQGEQNYDLLLKEASRAYFDRHTIRYLGDEKMYARIMSHGILGRRATEKEQKIILEEVLNTIVPESGLPLKDHIPESPRHGYFDFGGKQNED